MDEAHDTTATPDALDDLVRRLRAATIPPELQGIKRPLAAVLDKLRVTLTASPDIDSKRFFVLKGGPLLGKSEALQMLRGIVAPSGGRCTDVAPSAVLWDDSTLKGWQYCFQACSASPPGIVEDCPGSFARVLSSGATQPPLFVFLDQLEHLAIQAPAVHAAALSLFFVPLLRDFYEHPVILLAAVCHLPTVPMQYLQSWSVTPTLEEIEVPAWEEADIFIRHPIVAELPEAERTTVLHLANGSPGLANFLAQHWFMHHDLSHACRDALDHLVAPYPAVEAEWPRYFADLSQIIKHKDNRVAKLKSMKEGPFNADELRTLLYLCIIEPLGTTGDYQVAAPFDQLIRGAK